VINLRRIPLSSQALPLAFCFVILRLIFCHSMACTRVCVVVLGLLLLLRVFCIIFRISCQVAVKFAWNGFLNAANSDSNNYIFEKWVVN